MNIEIGIGPDFVMTRGHEILSYRFQMVVQFPHHKTESRVLTNRSLAMICKEARSIYRFAAGLNYEEHIEINDSKEQFSFGVKGLNIGANIKFMAHVDLLPNQIDVITGSFIELFKVRQIGGKRNF